MFNRKFVYAALNRTFGLDNNQRLSPYSKADSQSIEISKLIFDIFGGEILKTHKNKGWHYYNRINGKRFDFAKSKNDKISKDYQFDDIPATADEIHNYFEQDQYSTFFTRFIWEFEEVVGLRKYRSDFSS